MSAGEELPLFIIGAVMSALLLLVLFLPFVLRFRLRRYVRFDLSVDGTPAEVLEAYAEKLRRHDAAVLSIEPEAGRLTARRAANTLTAHLEGGPRRFAVRLDTDGMDLAAIDRGRASVLTVTPLAWFALRLEATLNRLHLAAPPAWGHGPGGADEASRPTPWFHAHLVRVNPFF